MISKYEIEDINLIVYLVLSFKKIFHLGAVHKCLKSTFHSPSVKSKVNLHIFRMAALNTEKFLQIYILGLVNFCAWCFLIS